MTLKEIRASYLKFFKNKRHEIIPSASLVPENDPTTLFTGSGMQPMIAFLLGAAHPLGNRIANSQRCFRAEDIDEVGDNRHTTYFEMLGNWSLGDYWKKEQLAWFFEFLTKKAKLDPKRLYVTVFSGDEKLGIPRDDESADVWKEIFSGAGIEAKEAEIITVENGAERGIKEGERIFYYGVKKNWWSRAGTPLRMPAGEPGGPDSEVFYEFEGVEHNVACGANCHPNCDCGRFMEIGNSVFMEFIKTSSGAFEKLKQRNVDFGGGLERITAAANGFSDMFRIDAIWPVVAQLEGLFGQKYGDHPDSWYAKGGDKDTAAFRRSCRVIADHVRAAVFIISDGVEASNKDRGYILRRIIRKAVFEGRKYGDYPPTWLEDVARAVISHYRTSYGELGKNEQTICEEMTNEAKKFLATLDTGMKILQRYLDGAKKRFEAGESAKKEVTGSEAFILFTTYGFPLELTIEKAREVGVDVDVKEFEAEFEKHKGLSRTSTAGVFKGGLADHSEKTVRLHTATHLMNAALRRVLGSHVWQKGSHITPERTRFDFTHPDKMTEEQKKEVENLVNGWVARDLPVKKDVMPLGEARKLNAVGAFGEKYPDTVSVYTVEDPATGEVVSREFCGGPHVSRTGEVGAFKILKEEAVAAGVRRLRAAVE